MINPASKNWLQKYLSMVEEGAIVLDPKRCGGVVMSECIHATAFSTGLIFGFPAKHIFYDPGTLKLNADERLKLLLLEHLVLDFILVRGKTENFEKEFIADLVEFYHAYNSTNLLNVFRFFVHDSDTVKLENIFARRVDVNKDYTQKFWLNYLCNSLVFLDVIAFRDYLKKGKTLEYKYEQYAESLLKIIIMASNVDGTIDKQEQTIFDVFLASAKIPDNRRSQLERAMHDNTSISFGDIPSNHPQLMRLFLLDLAVLTIFSDLQALDVELTFLEELRIHLKLSEDQLDQSIALIQSFVIAHNHNVSFLQEKSSYDKLFLSFSSRWLKVLGRNKDKLAAELSESKELISLVKKSLHTELTEEEKEKVGEQFKDIIKSMPALAIFMLPGGALLLPIILKIVPALLPSAFRDNE
jgi:hypothetical protein